MWRKIDVSVDTFALLWGARRPEETTEDEIVARLAKQSIGDAGAAPRSPRHSEIVVQHGATTNERADRPKSETWVDVLVWTLKRLGGRGNLQQIYQTSREARKLLGKGVTLRHNDSARERLESYCSESKNYKGIKDLFYMPEGKGAGVWALRKYP